MSARATGSTYELRRLLCKGVSTTPISDVVIAHDLTVAPTVACNVACSGSGSGVPTSVTMTLVSKDGLSRLAPVTVTLSGTAATDMRTRVKAAVCDESGASLIFALIIISVIALVSAGVLTLGDTSVRSTVLLRERASAAYAGDAAAEIAINQLRNGNFNGVCHWL